MKKQDPLVPLMFGQDVISVQVDSVGSGLTLSKPAENYTNLILWADVPRPLSYSKARGFTWSGEFRDAETIPSLVTHVGGEWLSRFTQLSSLSIDGLSLMNCLDAENARALGKTFGTMTQLRTLKLKRVLSVDQSVKSDVAKDVNLAIQNLFKVALAPCVNLQEFECHYNNLSAWNAQTWSELSAGSEVLKKLKRLSIKDTSCDVKSSRFLWDALTNNTTLESCEIKILNSENTIWGSLLSYVQRNMDLRVLEMGAFDLNIDSQQEVIINFWNVSAQLRSFGLKLINFNPLSAAAIFSILCENSPVNFCQLILEVDSLREVDLFEYAKDLLDSTPVLDIRIIIDNVDVTPPKVLKLCIDKIYSLRKEIELTIVEQPAKAVELILQLIARLGVNNSSVPVLGHHIEALFSCFQYLLWKGERKMAEAEFAIFCNQVIKWIKNGAVEHNFLINKFRQDWGREFSNVLMRVIPVFMMSCSQEEAESILPARFSEIIKYKLADFSKRFDALNDSDVETLYVEVMVFFDFINDPRYRAFINPAELNSCLPRLSHYKDSLSKRIGIEKPSVQEPKKRVDLGKYLKPKTVVSVLNEIHVRVNASNPFEADNNFVYTGELLLEYVQHNKDLTVLEMGTFDLNHPQVRDFITKLLTHCGTLGALGLKLVNFNDQCAVELLNRINQNDHRRLSQLILDVDTLQNVDLSRFTRELLQKTAIIDLRIVQNNVDLTPEEIGGLCKQKIEGIMARANSDKEKDEASDIIVLLEDLAERLCQDQSSVAISEYHVFTRLSICLQLDKVRNNKNNEILNKFIAQLLHWLDLGKISHHLILKMLELPCWKDFSDQVLRLIAAVIDRWAHEQKEGVLLSLFRDILKTRFEANLRKYEEISQIQSVDKEYLNIFFKELCGFIVLINDNRFSALITEERQDDMNRLVLITNCFKDLVHIRYGKKKYFLKECIESQVKNISKKLISTVVSILSDDSVIDEGYLYEICQVILPKIDNIEKLVLFSDLLAEEEHSQHLLKLSLVMLHIAAIKGFEDTEGKFQVRVVAYMKLLDLNSAQLNGVMQAISSYAERLLNIPETKAHDSTEKQENKNILIGRIPGTDADVEFTEEKAKGNGSCGFSTLGVSRKQVVDVLLPLSKNEEALEMLWEEIAEAFETNFLKRTPEFESLYQILQDTNITADIYDKTRLQIEEYCKQEDIYKMYVKAYNDKLWLGRKSALLYAKHDKITVYIWEKMADEKHLKIKDFILVEKPKQVIHMLYIPGVPHFNLLVEAHGFEIIPEDPKHSDPFYYSSDEEVIVVADDDLVSGISSTPTSPSLASHPNRFRAGSPEQKSEDPSVGYESMFY